eukprot:TRINITY_DN18158_c0_g1_i2.p1 TRINITY_DN18158_c0_g1~~TRINITY_DN18158_c0_g1_i2.p1  ORF type:complete len:293 (-),score=60.33 TRINITY_DN18158_c0_g1_i2:202-1080(-)
MMDEDSQTAASAEASQDTGSPVKAFLAACLRRWPVVVFLGLLACAGILGGTLLQEQVATFLVWIKDAGIEGVLIFIAANALWLVCLLPKTPFLIAGGYIYGWSGLPVVVAGSTLGGLLAYGIATALLKFCKLSQLPERLCERYPELRLLCDMIEAKPYRALMLSRLVYIATPVKNYGLALIGAPLLPYMVAVGFSTILYSVPTVYVGTTLSDLSVYLNGDSKVDGGAAVVKMLPAVLGITISVILVMVFAKVLRTRLMQEAQPLESSKKDDSVTPDVHGRSTCAAVVSNDTE